MYSKIKALADKYSEELNNQVKKRIEEMKDDDTSYYLIYRVLGVNSEEGRLTDLYQNKGRFLYKYAAAFLEDAARLCIRYKFPNAIKTRIPNMLGTRPKHFEVDCLINNDLALEIKWRDATTYGDHITKEHTRVKAIKACGYIPVRIMFYYPQRKQAQKVQETLETLYRGIGGRYYYGANAWNYMKELTDIDLSAILEQIANSRG